MKPEACILAVLLSIDAEQNSVVCNPLINSIENTLFVEFNIYWELPYAYQWEDDYIRNYINPNVHVYLHKGIYLVDFDNHVFNKQHAVHSAHSGMYPVRMRVDLMNTTGNDTLTSFTHNSDYDSQIAIMGIDETKWSKTDSTLKIHSKTGEALALSKVSN